MGLSELPKLSDVTGSKFPLTSNLSIIKWTSEAREANSLLLSIEVCMYSVSSLAIPSLNVWNHSYVFTYRLRTMNTVVFIYRWFPLKDWLCIYSVWKLCQCLDVMFDAVLLKSNSVVIKWWFIKKISQYVIFLLQLWILKKPPNFKRDMYTSWDLCG